ncbi:MAG TPA: hypothetical protein VHL11_25350 [Phototrophicaceae bacterium]|jgi:hypothetical protein|nr:hypothetical protein [Phototrophicaceae bacterium]
MAKSSVFVSGLRLAEMASRNKVLFARKAVELKQRQMSKVAIEAPFV